MKRALLGIGIVTWITLLGAGVYFYINQNLPAPVVNVDSACERKGELYCHDEITDNVPLKNESGFKTETKASQLSDRTFTYQIEVRGNAKTDKASFAASVAETLNNPKGWGQIANFTEGTNSGFIIILTDAASVPTYSNACSSQWSCRVGPYVIINEDRWLGATTSWNSSGGSLRDYQHMVVNHEVGHWLGHGHVNCGGPGKLAPIMQQQSISLQGCRHNPWPLTSELQVDEKSNYY